MALTAGTDGVIKGELQHCTGKSRYQCTDRKRFELQLTRIERRVTRLRRIRNKINPVPELDNERAISPSVHHHIGKSQNLPYHIGTFLQQHEGDPAIQVRAPN